jgi:hypothetical protein
MVLLGHVLIALPDSPALMESKTLVQLARIRVQRSKLPVYRVQLVASVLLEQLASHPVPMESLPSLLPKLSPSVSPAPQVASVRAVLRRSALLARFRSEVQLVAPTAPLVSTVWKTVAHRRPALLDPSQQGRLRLNPPV